MTEEKQSKDVNLGMFNRPRQTTMLPGDLIAAVLSVVWVVFCAAFFIFAGRPESTIVFNSLSFVITVLAVVLPIALIWVAAVAARSVTVVREESIRLQAAVDSLRQNYVDLAQTNRMQVTPAAKPVTPVSPPVVAPAAEPEPAIEAEPDAPEAEAEDVNPAATFATTRKAAPVAEAQPDLALNYPDAPATHLSTEDLIRALHFPRTAEDKIGFRSLRLGLADPRLGKLIQASQDVLTLLSQEGVYMDDLDPDRARPDVWRKFAEGERGRAIATLGGVRDRASLSLAAQRMRKDHIFRDAAHHFLRQFDKMFARFAPEATDAEIAALAETRTARAFMLLGRVAGTFD